MVEKRKDSPGTGTRTDTVVVFEEAGEFSIESTTMRLKSINLHRTEQQEKEVERAAARKARADLMSASPEKAGRITHDDRGAAVWDWAVATGEFKALSTTSVIRKLDNVELKIEETQRAMRALKPTPGDGANPYDRQSSGNPYDRVGGGGISGGGSGDPYNQRMTANRPASKPTIKPAPKPAATKSSSPSVLDQLLGRKKK